MAQQDSTDPYDLCRTPISPDDVISPHSCRWCKYYHAFEVDCEDVCHRRHGASDDGADGELLVPIGERGVLCAICGSIYRSSFDMNANPYVRSPPPRARHAQQQQQYGASYHYPTQQAPPKPSYGLGHSRSERYVRGPPLPPRELLVQGANAATGHVQYQPREHRAPQQYQQQGRTRQSPWPPRWQDRDQLTGYAPVQPGEWWYEWHGEPEGYEYHEWYQRHE